MVRKTERQKEKRRKKEKLHECALETGWINYAPHGIFDGILYNGILYNY